MDTKVSIIIPTYNAEKYIAEAIDSVLAQTYPCVECIVVDDGSTDRTPEIVAGYGGRVRYIRQENAERSAARNNGIASSTGDYISFLDADDLLLPGKLEAQVAFLAAHAEMDVVYSPVRYFRDNREREYYEVRRIAPTGDVAPFLVWSNFITMNAPLFRRGAVARVAGFDLSLSRYEDWDFLLRLALTGSRFGYLATVFALCRMHGENTVGDAVRMFEAKLAVARKIAGQFGRELGALGIDGESLIAFHRADYGRKLILAGRAAEGRRLVEEACCHDFPHRGKFRIFSIVAALGGHKMLGVVQRYADRLLKYRKAGE